MKRVLADLDVLADERDERHEEDVSAEQRRGDERGQAGAGALGTPAPLST